MLWADNFYRPRFIVNPLIQYSTLNCSVFAVLRLSNLLPPYPRFSEPVQFALEARLVA